MATATATATRKKRKGSRNKRRVYLGYQFKRARARHDRRTSGKSIELLPDAYLQPYIETLVYECDKKQWGPAQLADASGVSYTTAAKHLCGDIKRPQFETCLWLLSAVGCTIQMR